jgi:coenzyme F420 hydrogenase subunit beta
VQWRCRLCPDHTGEFADISVGDPWHTPPTGNDPGRSLILARTQRGLRFVNDAIAERYLSAEMVEPSSIASAQPNLLKARAKVWGRTLGWRLMGMPAPRYVRMPLLGHWMRQLSLREKLQSIAGTMRRIYRRKLWQAVETS